MAWTREDIKSFNYYRDLQNQVSSYPEDILMDSQEEIAEIFLLEAKFIINNETVLGYGQGKPIGIYTFKEALKKKQDYIKQGQVFTFKPVNHRNIGELFLRIL